MIGNLTHGTHIAFTEQDIPSDKLLHNDALHLEAYIHKKRIRRVLIDGGAGLNICTLKLVKALGYFELHIDSSKRINIKAYDDEERPSKGIVALPVQIGPITTEVAFQVLDRELGYNMLLGCPWIHTMQAVPSTFHQCIKFPYNGIEITIKGDPNPFQHCNYLKDSVDNQVPINQAAPLTT